MFAALAVSHWVETRTSWSIKKFVRTTRRYRTVNIRAGDQIITAADPLPDDLREALAKIPEKMRTNLIRLRLHSLGGGRWRGPWVALWT